MNPYKIYTLYYGKRDATTADYFLDDTSNIPIGMGYYLWVATNGEHTVVIDLGYHEDAGERRGRTLVRHPAELLDKVQVDPKTVQHAIVTHLHWDHVGGYALFPNARFYLQERELHFWTSSHLAEWQSSLEEEELVAVWDCAMAREKSCRGSPSIMSAAIPWAVRSCRSKRRGAPPWSLQMPPSCTATSWKQSPNHGAIAWPSRSVAMR